MKFALRAGDIRALYEAARSLGGIGGAPYLNRLFDAEAALNNGRLDRVSDVLSATRREFEKSHTRILRLQPGPNADSSRTPKEQVRLQSRKDQVEAVLARFDEYHAVVERMAERAERNGTNADATEPEPGVREGEGELPAGFAEAYTVEATTDNQFRVVDRFFECAAVELAGDVVPGSLYFLRTKATGHLLRTSASVEGPTVPLTDAITGKDVRAQRLEALVEQGRRGKLYALTKRRKTELVEPFRREEQAPTSPSSDPLEAQNTLLDKQLFNVLMTAVRNSGLDVSTELIVQVRDNEFRKGEYLDAFEKLNQLSTRYEVSAARRKEELRRHDQWLSSGQSGLSLREVEEAKLKNAQERTRLEHASHRFGLVVEPLRILARGAAQR